MQILLLSLNYLTFKTLVYVMEAVRVVSCESYYDLREIIQYRLHNFPTQCIILDENGKSPNTEKREALATKLPWELRSTTGHTPDGNDDSHNEYIKLSQPSIYSSVHMHIGLGYVFCRNYSFFGFQPTGIKPTGIKPVPWFKEPSAHVVECPLKCTLVPRGWQGYSGKWSDAL